jgi:hypothetical protein
VFNSWYTCPAFNILLQFSQKIPWSTSLQPLKQCNHSCLQIQIQIAVNHVSIKGYVNNIQSKTELHISNIAYVLDSQSKTELKFSNRDHVINIKRKTELQISNRAYAPQQQIENWITDFLQRYNGYPHDPMYF